MVVGIKINQIDLIKPNGSWDKDKLEEIVSPRRAREILEVQTPTSRPQDKIIWAPIRDGNFTVQFAKKYFTSDG